MKKILTAFFYLIWFAVPALIVQYYHNFIDPMTDEEIKMATLAGTVAMIILAVFSGFGGKKSADKKGSVKKAVKNTPPVIPKSRIIRDPATNAERQYFWNEDEGVWESDDGKSILDESRLSEWERQRISDREWADRQMEKLKNRETAFDKDMDEWNRKQKKELEEMEKQMERSRKFGEKHGKYDLSDEEMKEFISKESARAEIEGQEWQEYGNEYDKIVDRLEWTQWGADFAMDIVDVLTLGNGKPIKYIYIANRNLAGDFMDCLINRKSISKTLLKTITKTTIDITQDSVNKIGYKYVANGVGDGIKESIAYAEEGKSAGKGFVKGLIKGTTRTGIEHGISNTKLKWNSKQTKIAQEATKKSSELLGKQQAGQISEKLSNALRNNVRTKAAQQIAAETGKQKDLLSNGLGKLSDGIWNKIIE